MSSSAWPDLWGLALSEGDTRRHMRASLFQLQTDMFVTAPVRDTGTIAAFEALALGFLPLIDEPTVIKVARSLAACPDTPEPVLICLCRRSNRARDAVLDLATRLPLSLIDEFVGSGPAQAAMLAARAALDEPAQEKLLVLHDDAVDEALAKNSVVSLSAMVRESLVERARACAPLARALLARSDLNLADEAALYLHADAVRQGAIRDRIAGSATVQGRAIPRRASDGTVKQLMALAAHGDAAGLEAALTDLLGLQGSPDWRFLKADRHALLALALRAAGVPGESADRIFLTLHPVIAHSVRTVFGLARTFRSVPRPIAVVLVEAIVGQARAQESPGRHLSGMDPSGTPSQGPVLAPERRPLGQERPRRTG